MTSRTFLRPIRAAWLLLGLGAFAGCDHFPASHRSTAEGAPSATVPAPAAPPASALGPQISAIHQQVALRRQDNENLRNFVAEKEKQLAAVLASDRSAGPNAQEFDFRTSINSKLADIDRTAATWQQMIDAHQAVVEKAASDPRGAELKSEVDQLTEQRAELLRQRAKLAALPAKLKAQ